MNLDKPYSEACHRNRDPLLEVLRKVLAGSRRVLEVGSGTGQHAVYFGEKLPHLIWQTSDLAENHAGINAWLMAARLENVLPPIDLDVNRTWPDARYDAVFSANTLHIISWAGVERMIGGIAGLLSGAGILAIYGPFNYGGQYTAESNRTFDQWLKSRDPSSGIRDFENVDNLARSHGFTIEGDYPMPANNRTLVWRRSV